MELILLSVIVTSIGIFFYCKNRYYWKGRCAGWIACENMVVERAREHKYDMEKFYSDILQ